MSSSKQSNVEQFLSKRCKITPQNHIETLNEYLLEYIFCLVNRLSQEKNLLLVCTKLRNFFLPKMPLTLWKGELRIILADNLMWLKWQIQCCSEPMWLGKLFELCMDYELDSCVEYLLRGNFNLVFAIISFYTATGHPICTCDRLQGDLLDISQRKIVFGRPYICDFFKRVSIHSPETCGRMLYQLAARNNDIEVMKLLDDRKFNGYHPVEFGPHFYESRSIHGGIRWACRCGHRETLNYLLCKWTDGRSPPPSDYLVDKYRAGLSRGLYWASRYGYLEIVKTLLGCPETDLTTDNKYALKWALNNNHKEIYALLIQGKRVKLSTVAHVKTRI